MTKKEQKYKAYYRSIGKHLHKNVYLPINLKDHPREFILNSRERKAVIVNWGWAARDKQGMPHIPFDEDDNPHPYEGFWEARCLGCEI